MGSCTTLLLVASGTREDSGDAGNKADGVKGFFTDLKTFPNPFYPERHFCGFHGDVRNGSASRGPHVLGGRDLQEQSHSVAPIRSLSMQIDTNRKIISLP